MEWSYKMIFHYVLLLLMLGASMCFGIDNSVPKKYFLTKKAEKAIENEDFDQALETYSKLMEESPNNINYQYNLGQIYMKQGDIERASKSYSSALSAEKDTFKIDAQLGLGATYLQQNKIEEAIDIFKAILRENPGFKPAKHNLELALRLKNMQNNEQQNQKNKSDQENKSDDQNEKNQPKDQQAQEQTGDKNEQSQEENANNQDENERTNDGSQEEDNKNSENIDQAQEKSGKDKEKEKAIKLLELFSKKEEEARKKYIKRKAVKVEVENDW